ncbi:hypothetical protein [Microbacterium thalassium]|uniref:Uncharacterized protein n=1 Tax=Microbacterium thalassium TaxID=362649 RepID=A0A7X0KT74_9MICO|nr:hypothetical protein [Microbacterium thalassium]MBB6389748.1 hypothetical protein [Microbacterium thalassium]GLK24433.1 hypothetical protein GCM10017607_17510 [Microbacterium thalassium]
MKDEQLGSGGLRARLAARLRQRIGQPEVEAKELRAFDVVMDRRQFLTTAQLGIVGGLVASGIPPTRWGAVDSALAVEPAEVGLTLADEMSVPVATQLTFGTELFQETIYSQPAVSPAAVGSHALIEGARNSRRLQSDLDSSSPAESAFLDTGFHWGSPELVQLEDTSSGWELVHYRQPWGARTDGASTDGMVREVIIGAGKGLKSPTQVLTITGSRANAYAGNPVTSGVTYVVVVIDADVAGGGFVCVGAGAWEPSTIGAGVTEYPVTWKFETLGSLGPGQAVEYADTYRTHGYENSTSYEAGNANEYIVLYYPGGYLILSLTDSANRPGYATLAVFTFDWPENDSGSRVVHIENDVVLAKSWADSSSFTFQTATLPLDRGTAGTPQTFLAPYVQVQKTSYFGQDYAVASFTADSMIDVDVPHFDTIGDVNALYTVTDDLGFKHHVKLARFQGTVALFVIFGEEVTLEGFFPLAVPEPAGGVGQPTTLSGGVSKFGGFRFVACNSDGNLFLLRQGRLQPQNSPYTDPVYGLFDASGNPAPPPQNTTSTAYDPIPGTTESSSNLHQLLNWVKTTTPPGEQNLINIGYNVLLNAALAFGTDPTNQSQAVWLGDSYQAAYAPHRFVRDSEHVEVKQAQGSSTQFSSYLTMCHPVTRTWHSRQIATQVLPQPPGLNESGDHWQATVAGANAYGRAVRMDNDANAHLQIEVRADSPTTVTDDTSNLYYDVDRYSSFLASPDPTTGRLALVVKAESFAQVLYARLVDTSGLFPSSGDAAMLASRGVETYAWQPVNLSAQGQQRLGNDGTASTLLSLGDDAPLVDTYQYVSQSSLYDDSTDPNGGWQFKVYGASQANMGNLAEYLNTSGQNILAANSQLALGASSGSGGPDPLTAVTAVPSQGLATMTATFTYPKGTIGGGPSTGPPLGDLGSIWSGISHALHDALHWLQNVEKEAYQALAEGAVGIELAADSITATVSADIMQAVNGVDSALEEVVQTVEEYANIVANLIVTIVEQSFLYQLIERIIALISLFWHLKDIQALTGSLRKLVENLLGGANGQTTPSIPAGSSWDVVGSYIGNDSVNALLQQTDTSAVPTEVTSALLDDIAANPFTTKLVTKVVSYVNQVVSGALKELPFSVSMPVEVDVLSEVEQDIVAAVENITVDTVQALVTNLAADVSNPQATFTNLSQSLGSLLKEVEQEVENVYDKLDQQAQQAVDYATSAVVNNSEPFVTLKVAELADLARLFGFGTVSGSNVTLTIQDAVYFPAAVVIWATLYVKDGTSTSNMGQVYSALSTSTSDELTGGSVETWTGVRLAVDFCLGEAVAGTWIVAANEESVALEHDPFEYTAAWMALIPATVNFVYHFTSDETPTFVNSFVPSWELLSALGTCYWTTAGPNTGAGWDAGEPRPSDLFEMADAFVALIEIIVAAVEAAEGDDAVVGAVGDILVSTTFIVTFLYELGESALEEAFPYVAVYVGAAPGIGYIMQMVDAFSAQGQLPPGTTNPKRKGPPAGRPRRPAPTPPGKAR